MSEVGEVGCGEGSVLSVVVAGDPGRMLVVASLVGGHREGGHQHPVADHQGQPLRY